MPSKEFIEVLSLPEVLLWTRGSVCKGQASYANGTALLLRRYREHGCQVPRQEVQFSFMMILRGSTGFKMTARSCWTLGSAMIVESLSLEQRGRFRHCVGVTNLVSSSVVSLPASVSEVGNRVPVESSTSIFGVFIQGTGPPMSFGIGARRSKGGSGTILRTKGKIREHQWSGKSMHRTNVAVVVPCKRKRKES